MSQSSVMRKGKREQPTTNTNQKKPRFCLIFFDAHYEPRSIIFLCRNYFEEWGDEFSVLNWKEKVGFEEFGSVFGFYQFVLSFGHWFLAVNQSFINHLPSLFYFRFSIFSFIASVSLQASSDIDLWRPWVGSRFVWVGLMTCQPICLCEEQA